MLLSACSRPTEPVAGASASSEPAAALPPPRDDRLPALRLAEQRRLVEGVTAEDQQSREVAVRRAAARALARIGGEGARAGLRRALGDDDEEVVAWAAYGLGFTCKGHDREHVAALVARALAWDGLAGPSVPDSGAPRGAGAPRLDASAALVRAIGRCGAEESEPTLVAWLQGPRDRAVAAAFALGDLANAKEKLREETLAALLNAAAGSAAAPPVGEALFPIGRLEHVPLTVVDRIREVATLRLADAGEARLYAVRALGRGGVAAKSELARVLTSPGVFTAGERVEAAKALKRLGRPGQLALGLALPSLVPSADPIALTGLVGDDFAVTLAALDAFDGTAPAGGALADLAALTPPPSAPASVVRRVSWMRCAAAKTLAQDDYRDKRLLACDVGPAPGAPEPAPARPAEALVTGSIGARAVVEVLGRAPLKGARLLAFERYASAGPLRAREAALELLEKHDEVAQPAALLAEALAAPEGGLVATAAEVLAKQPQRAGDDAKGAHGKHPRHRRKPARDEPIVAGEPLAASPAVVSALLAALGRPAVVDDPELATEVIDAAGALALADSRPRLEELCTSPWPITREHAAKALGLVTGKKVACDAPAGGGSPPAELDHLVGAPVTLAFDTEAGPMTLTLDPTLAPVTVTRLADLARAGYYDGLVVHRVAAGFVTQFGAPFGDGYGGPAGQPPLRCETSPLPFERLAVGVALAGRDTGSSQLFVMHARHPHLDGSYALIGTAGGDWASFVDGDVIRSVKVSP